MRLREIEQILDEKLIKDTCYEWDNCGLIVSTCDKDIKKILYTLEVSDEVVQEAKMLEIDLIISHHPLFISSIKSVKNTDIYQNILIKLIQNDIQLYSCHTNYDKHHNGLNDYVIRMLDVNNVKYLVDKDGEDCGMGRIATLSKKMTMEEFLKYIQKVYHLDDIRLTFKNYDKEIKKVAIVTGSGSEFAKIAFEKGADIFLTGDIKYHFAQEAYYYGYNVVDIGHYGSEKFFPDAIEKTLSGIWTDDIQIFKSTTLPNPIVTLSREGCFI